MTEETITQAAVLEALSTVMDPELGTDLVSANMIRNIRIDGGDVTFSLILTTSACPLKKELEEGAANAVSSINGVTGVTVEVGAEVPQAKSHSQGHGHEGAGGCGGGHEEGHDHGHEHSHEGEGGGGCGSGGGASLPPKEEIPGVKNTIAVASGKGGVGKSTVSVNLALALAKEGARVGLLDADLYGPSIPLMMGIHEPLKASEDERIVPLNSYGIKLVSVGFMIDEETPLIWRGPLIMQLVKQFLLEVNWGKLDYLVIDLPPGTGDTQLTLVQTIPLSGAVIVTTPQDVALIDARRAIKMFNEVKVPILGIVENMSYFTCPHCNEKTEIFSSGGGEKTSERYNVPLIGKIPLDPIIREGGDAGKPVVEAEPDSEHTKDFVKISQKVASSLSVLALT